MTSVYNFNPDNSISTDPENILIPNVKPRSGLNVRYLYPLMYKQMTSSEKPDILVVSPAANAADYLNLATLANYQHNIPNHDGIPDIDQLNQVRFDLPNKPTLTYYVMPHSAATSNIYNQAAYSIAKRTIFQIMDHDISLHMLNDKPLKVIIDDVATHLCTELPNLLEYLMEYLAIGLGKHIQLIIASDSDPRMMSPALAGNVTVINNLDDYSINLDLYRK